MIDCDAVEVEAGKFEDTKRLRVLLVAPLQADANVQNWGAPSLGLMRIDSYVKKRVKNVEIEIFDPQIDFYDPLKKFAETTIHIIGISILHYTLTETLDFIHQWRKIHPESLIVVGGNEASANYQDIFDKSPCDIAVLIEGEEVMLKIILWQQGKLKLEAVPGIVYRRYAEMVDEDKFWDFWKDVNFADYRYPAYWQETAKLFEQPNWEEVCCIRLTPSNYCKRKCTFCSLNFVHNICCNQNAKPVALKGWQIMELIDKIKVQVPKTRTIYFCNDDIFYPNRQYFEDFVELYEKSGYDYRIIVQTSSYCLKEADFPLLKRIGCVHISVGVENASERLRKSMKKPQDSEKIEMIVDWSHQYGIKVYYLIILIPPESTLEELWLNIRTIRRWMAAGVGISIMPVIYAYRGMPLFEDNRYQIMYRTKLIGATGVMYNDPYCVLPNDPVVRELTLEFIQREWDYVNKRYEERENKLKFKGGTSEFLLDLLEELLLKYEEKI